MSAPRVQIDGVDYVPSVRPSEALHESLGEHIRRARRARRMSLDVAANSIGYTKSYLWELERRGACNPGFDLMVRISRLYGISLDVLAAYVNTEGTTP